MKDDSILFQSSEEGMRPLYQAIDSLGLPALENSVVVDKIVGKAAALVVSYCRVKEIHCIVLSNRGKEFLERRAVSHYWERLTPEISNKFGTDICPFEKAVKEIEDPYEGYKVVYTLLKELNLY